MTKGWCAKFNATTVHTYVDLFALLTRLGQQDVALLSWWCQSRAHEMRCGWWKYSGSEWRPCSLVSVGVWTKTYCLPTSFSLSLSLSLSFFLSLSLSLPLPLTHTTHLQMSCKSMYVVILSRGSDWLALQNFYMLSHITLSYTSTDTHATHSHTTHLSNHPVCVSQEEPVQCWNQQQWIKPERWYSNSPFLTFLLICSWMQWEVLEVNVTIRVLQQLNLPANCIRAHKTAEHYKIWASGWGWLGEAAQGISPSPLQTLSHIIIPCTWVILQPQFPTWVPYPLCDDFLKFWQLTASLLAWLPRALGPKGRIHCHCRSPGKRCVWSRWSLETDTCMHTGTHKPGGCSLSYM